MSPIIKDIPKPYTPTFPFKNGHINTIYPTLFRTTKGVAYNRIRMITSDDDFIDLDYSKVGSKKAAILCHGLEGNSQSSYILGMAKYLNQNDLDIISVNYRGCSGEMNRNVKMYNSGATDDLHEIIQFVEQDYDELYLIGFSLGGNLILKYLGEGKYQIPDKIKANIAFSTPVDLAGSIKTLEASKTSVYTNRFLISLREKIKLKHKQHPKEYSLEPLKKIKTLQEFDDKYTAPIHGYNGAQDYYSKCMSKQFLPNIKKPTLLANALDDPFLGEDCMPFEEARNSDYFHFLATDYGGHVGFASYSKTFWSEVIALDFIKNPLSFNS